jgi:hypothetical protein
MGDIIMFGHHRAAAMINDFSNRYPNSLPFAVTRRKTVALLSQDILPVVTRSHSLNGIPEDLMCLWRELGFSYCKGCGVGVHLTFEHLRERHGVDTHFDLYNEVNKCLGNAAHRCDYSKPLTLIKSWRLVRVSRK